MTPEERKAMKEVSCRYFNGIQNETCEAGLKYPPWQECSCRGKRTDCPSYARFSAEELSAQEAALQRHVDLIRKGLSGCCEAPFDTSQVITNGQFKNHGPRFCSKCGKLAFMV